MVKMKKDARGLFDDQAPDGMAFERISKLGTPCGVCGVGSVGILVGDYGPHYAKRICLGCSRFRGWEPRPNAGGGAIEH
jgi:hypothetical protein